MKQFCLEARLALAFVPISPLHRTGGRDGKVLQCSLGLHVPVLNWKGDLESSLLNFISRLFSLGGELAPCVVSNVTVGSMGAQEWAVRLRGHIVLPRVLHRLRLATAPGPVPARGLCHDVLHPRKSVE